LQPAKPRPTISPRACSLRPQAPASIPGIEVTSVGVNLLAIDPDGGEHGRDSALGSLAIFNLSTAGGKTWNGEWAVPDPYAFRPSPGCSYTSSVNEVDSTYGYMQSLHEWVQTRVHVLWWHHTKTKSFDEVSQRTADSRTVMTRAKASCTSYEIAVDDFALTPASLTRQFVTDVEALPESASAPGARDVLLGFVSRWGTSYLSRALLGGSFTLTTSFARATFTKLEEEHSDLRVGASLAFLAHFGDSRLAQDANFREYETFMNASQSASVAFVGPSLPPNGTDVRLNATRWSEQVLLPAGSPAIVGYTAANLSSLVARPDLFPGLPPLGLAARALTLDWYVTDPAGYCADVGCDDYTRQSRWQALPALPTPLRSTAVTSDGRTVYVVGGASSSVATTAVRTGMLAIDMTAPAPAWRQLPPPFYGASPADQDGLASAAASVNASDASLWVCGGVDAAGTAQGGVARYDPATAQWRAQGALATPRWGHCSAMIGSVFFAVGGTDATAAMLSSVEAFDAATGITTSRAPLPSARAGLACAVVDGRIWATGGLVAGAASDVIDVYDPLLDAWSPGPAAMPEPRVDHSAVLVGSTLFVVGGASDASGTAATSTWAFNTTGGLLSGWQQAPPLGLGRVAAGAAPAHQPSSLSPAEGPENAGTMLVLVGGSAEPGAGTAALSSSLGLKVYDQHGNFVYVPPTTARGRQRAPGALASLHRQRSRMAEAEPERKRREQERRASLRRQAGVPEPAPAPSALRGSRAQPAAAATAAAGPALPIWPSADLLSHTYNFIAATPGAQRDAGWLARGAFQVACPSCFSQNRSLNGRFAVPDGVSVNQLDASACSYDASSLTVRTAAELQASLALFAKLNAWSFDLSDLVASSFSAGVDASVTASASATAEAALVAASAECSAFEMALDSYDFAPAFEPGFAAAAASLPANLSDPLPWLAFFEEFGLAYPTAMTVGARATQLDVVAELDFHQLLQVSASVDVKASVSFLFLFGASVSKGGSFRFKEWLDFSDRVAVNSTQCQPECPPQGDDILSQAGPWRERALRRPVPLTFTLAPIWDLVAPPAEQRASAARLGLRWASDPAGPARPAAHPLGTLHGVAHSSGDADTARRLADAAALLRTFAAGSYCPLTPGCGILGGRPYWTRPEAPSGRELVLRSAWAVGGSVVLPSDGNTSFAVVAGGVQGQGLPPTTLTLVFNTAIPGRGWMSAAAMPRPTSHAAAAELPLLGALLSIGGATIQAAPLAATCAFQMTPQGGRWTDVGNLPATVARSGAAAAGNTVVSFGGCTDGPACAAPTADVYVGTVTSTSPVAIGWVNGSHGLPQGPAYDVAAVASADGATIFVAGGWTAATAAPSPTVYAFDVATRTWDLTRTTAAPRAFAAAAAVLLDSSRILLTGGVSVDPVTAAVAVSSATYIFDPNQSAWEVAATGPWPSQGAAAVLLRGGPPGAGDTPGSPEAVNATLPALWLVGGQNGTAAKSPALSIVAQLRNIPAQ